MRTVAAADRYTRSTVCTSRSSLAVAGSAAVALASRRAAMRASDTKGISCAGASGAARNTAGGALSSASSIAGSCVVAYKRLPFKRVQAAQHAPDFLTPQFQRHVRRGISSGRNRGALPFCKPRSSPSRRTASGTTCAALQPSSAKAAARPACAMAACRPCAESVSSAPACSTARSKACAMASGPVVSVVSMFGHAGSKRRQRAAQLRDLQRNRPA